MTENSDSNNALDEEPYSMMMISNLIFWSGFSVSFHLVWKYLLMDPILKFILILYEDIQILTKVNSSDNDFLEPPCFLESHRF